MNKQFFFSQPLNWDTWYVKPFDICEVCLVYIQSTFKDNLLTFTPFLFLQDGDVLNFLWQQEADPGQQSEGPGYGNHRQPLEPLLSSFDDDDRFRADVWTAGRHYHSHGDPPFGADVQQVRRCTWPVHFIAILQNYTGSNTGTNDSCSKQTTPNNTAFCFGN